MNRATINHFKTAMLFIMPGAVSAVFGYAMAGRIGLVLCFAVYSLLATASFLWADRMILSQHNAEHIPESRAAGLYALVNELSRRATSVPPRLYLLPETAPQLLVTGRRASRGAIAISKGLLTLLSTEELAALIAHAIDHLRSGETRPMTIAAGLVQCLISLSNFFRWSNLLGSKLVRTEKQYGPPSDAFLWVVIAPIAAALIRGVVYPSRQFRADQASAHVIGNSSSLCAALTKIEAHTPEVSPKSVSVATAHLFVCSPRLRLSSLPLFRTHPPIADRLDRLEALGRTIHFFQRLTKCSSHEQTEAPVFRKERTNI
jgi:heat shock protein HtpX